MKKNAFLAVLITLLATPAFAQYWGPYLGLQQSSQLSEQITKAFRHVFWLDRVHWVLAVRREERSIDRPGPLGSSCYAVTTKSFPQQPVCAADETVFNQRKELIQARLKKNHTLAYYRFKVPQPHDLARLTDQQLTFITDFLAQPAEEENFNTQFSPSVNKPQQGVTELTFANKPMVLRIDSRAKTVYFFYRG